MKSTLLKVIVKAVVFNNFNSHLAKSSITSVNYVCDIANCTTIVSETD